MLRKLMSWSIVVMATLTSNAFAQGSKQETPLPSPRLLARYGLERAWWSQATLNIYRDKIAHVTLDEENLYVLSTGGAFTALDAETGRKRFSVQLGRGDSPSYPAVSNDELVLVNAGMMMYAVEKTTGDVKWSLELPSQPSTGPTVDNLHVYYGTLDGSIYAFDLKQIEKLHNANRLPQWTDIAKKWRFKTAAEVTSAPIISTGVINFASRDKSLYSVSRVERKLQWQFETKKPISAPMGRSSGMLFLGTEDLNVFAIDQEKGAVRWQFVAGLPIRKQPRVIEDDVYVFPEAGGVHALNRLNGSPKARTAGPSDFIAATKTVLLTSDDVGNLIVLSRRDLAIIGALNLSDYKVRLGNDLTDRAYLATRTGLVICLREVGKEFPTYHLFPERQPLLPEFAPEETADPTPAENAAQ